jgi:hypothetical protein
MANTYVAIATTTVGSGGTASIDFTSIPGTYTDLLVKLSSRTDRVSDTDSVKLEVNGSTTSYTWLYLLNNSGTVSSATAQRFFTNASQNTASTFASADIYIPNYTSSNNKSFSIDTSTENNSTTVHQQLLTQLWSNTAAITSIKLSPQFGVNFVQYTTATLYGIKSS